MPTRFDSEAGAKRLVRKAQHISEAEWQAGAEWYPAEGRWITEQAALADALPNRAIAAYACLSPRLQLGQNRKALVAVLNGRRPSGVFGASVRAAERCLSACTERPHGPKTANFACNLAGCGDCVTVDVWAAKAAGYDGRLDTFAQYDRVRHAYRLAARRLGVEPRTLQAAMWLHVRGAKPSDQVDK